MLLALALWVVVMVGSLHWPVWAVTGVSAAAVGALVVTEPAAMAHAGGWLQAAAFLAAPQLLLLQQRRLSDQLKRLQVTEVARVTALQDVSRRLSRVQTENQELEERVSQITNLYHVTKDTARCLHLEELFTAALDILPRLLDVRGVRLVDLEGPGEAPVVLRARRVPDGRLVAESSQSLLTFEQEIITRAAQTGLAAIGDTSTFGAELPAGVSRVGWVTLWSEHQPIGVVVADELPQEQLETLAIVANQLALQLSRIHLYQRIESLAITDSLTGLAVRRYFLEVAAGELTRSQRHGLSCAVLMVDLDHFKAKNDTYGHLVGDVVLREVAQLLRKNLREVDMICRYGGEEFVLLLIETDAEAAMVIGQRLRQLVEIHSIRAYDELLAQTISVGLACFPQDGASVQELLDRADEALYAAKRIGRNRTIRWTPSVRTVSPGLA